MNQSFEAKVTDINLKEYMSALRWLQMQKERNLIIAIAVIFAALFLCGSNKSPLLLLLPIGMIIFVIGYYEITHMLDYRKFPKEIELNYEIDAHGWRLRVGDGSSVCAWANTVKLVDTKSVFLLYNTKTSSNLLPKRCLTQEQIELIRYWHKNRFNLADSDIEDENVIEETED